jgi:hypothetical protein
VARLPQNAAPVGIQGLADAKQAHIAAPFAAEPLSGFRRETGVMHF